MNTELSKNPIITIRSAQLNTNTITITIEDNGSGIDMENYALLFTPYFTTKPDGMGLGLAISHTIISAHNGYLSARNLPQGGACFEFTLPIRAC
jgi:signal transduction histidine kinase